MSKMFIFEVSSAGITLIAGIPSSFWYYLGPSFVGAQYFYCLGSLSTQLLSTGQYASALLIEKRCS